MHGTLPPPGPLRRLACGALVTSIGNGAWYTSWALFLTDSVGLTPAEVGLGMTVAGALGLLLAVPAGHLADRVGPREVFAALLTVQAAGAAAYLAVDGLAPFMVVACATVAASRASGGARNALVVCLVGEHDRLQALGSLRSLNHLGWAAGAAVGALIIGLDSRDAYVAMIVLDAATFLAYAAAVITVPRVPPMPQRQDGPALVVLRDAPYVTLAALMGVLALCWGMLSSGLPLWVARHTDAPQSLSAAIVILNSLAIAALQVRVTRTIASPLVAARGAVWAGATLAASCLLFALTEGRGGLGAATLLLAAGALHVAGELLFVAASWGLSIPLMPSDAPGQYQGMFSTGEATAQMVAPVLMTTLVVGWGQPGWIVLGALFVLATAPAVPATRWALRTRTATSPA
jgi:MFS family permease